MTIAIVDQGAASDPHARPVARPFPGPASKRIVVGFGFWIFLLSDFIMFSAFFAAYAVLSGETAGGPTGKQLFNLTTVAIETAALLASSFACGMSALAVQTRQTGKVYAASFFTFLFGLVFLTLEIQEFARMVGEGAGPQRSAFLSSFFSLVGLHGLHVTAGLVWLTVMMGQIATRGFMTNTLRRFMCFALFWHALDIIWVALFTVVYLMGAGKMTDETHGHADAAHSDGYDSAPGDENKIDVIAGTKGYLLGVALATILTAASFWTAGTDLIWAPGIPIALGVLAVAQMGVHLVFFLHISTGPDNTNNILALAFGIMIVILVVAGSLWIMANLNHNMLPMDQLMKMQR